MKQKISKLIALVICLSMVTACGGGDDHAGEAKTPSASSAQEGRNYLDVAEDFEDKGFTNIHFEVMDDLLFGWLTEDGEVEWVSVDGNVEYKSDEWYPADTKVVIAYHTFPEANAPADTDVSDDVEDEPVESEPEVVEPAEPELPEVLTVDNCPELAAALAAAEPNDPAIKLLDEKYGNETIEFDGYIAYCTNYEDYTTIYSLLIYAGDPESARGPNFHIKRHNDSYSYGTKIRVKADIDGYNDKTQLFELDSAEITYR